MMNLDMLFNFGSNHGPYYSLQDFLIASLKNSITFIDQTAKTPNSKAKPICYTP